MQLKPIFIACLALSAAPAFSDSYQQIADIKQSEITTPSYLKSPRLKAVKEEAMAQGTQRGYNYQMQYLQDRLKASTQFLNKLYDFSTLMRVSSRLTPISNILPPVIEHAKNAIKVAGAGNQMTISGTVYKILQPARLVSLAPRWQGYLLSSIQPVAPVTKILAPKNDEEQQMWQDTFAKAWNQGRELANQEMEYRIRKLKRDYNGMILYLSLYRSGKVNAPFVAFHNQAVQGDANQMYINNDTFQITQGAALNRDPSAWKVAWEGYHE